MDASWTAVIIATVGFAATLGGVWLGNRNAAEIDAKRREDARTEREASEAAAAAERRPQLRTAARLIVAELERADAALRFASEKRRWWWEPLPLDAWTTYGPPLAGAMNIEEWDLVRRAYDLVESAERRRRLGEPLASVPDLGGALVQSSSAIQAAVFALNRYAKVEVPSLLPPDDETDHPGYGAALAALSMLGEPAIPPGPPGPTSPAPGEADQDAPPSEQPAPDP